MGLFLGATFLPARAPAALSQAPEAHGCWGSVPGCTQALCEAGYRDLV